MHEEECNKVDQVPEPWVSKVPVPCVSGLNSALRVRLERLSRRQVPRPRASRAYAHPR